MEYKKLIVIGDAHFRGDGAEWPKLYGHLGPIPNDYRANIWQNRIKKAKPEDLPNLNREFYQAIGDKIKRCSDEVLSLRQELSFGSILASELGLEYVNYCQSSGNIEDILPFFKHHSNEESLKGCLVFAGIPSSVNNITFNQKGDKLKNITLNYIASHIMLLKEYVENRGGHFIYMHTEDFPELLYDPERNPFLVDLMLLLVHRGNIQSLMTNAYYWRKYDGHYFDSSAQKNLAQNLKKLVVDLI